MEQRKSYRADLETKRILFLEIGFIIALSIVFVAFQYKSYETINYVIAERVVDNTAEEIIPITEHKVKPPPPKPPPQVSIINVVDNEVVVDDEIVVDIEFDEDVAMEEYIFVVEEEEEEEVEEQHIFLIVEEMPEYPGGEEAMYEFIANNINYPRMARESGIVGRVYVAFVVERDGSVTDVQILRGIGCGCDEEAIRVIKSMPKWSPGKQRGKAVRVQYRMPIKFALL